MSSNRSRRLDTLLPVLYADGYKVGHPFQYPADTEMVYSNFTPRNTHRDDSEGIIFFGLQYFVQEYLVTRFNENFFERDEDEVVAEYGRRIFNYLGPECITLDHIRALHRLGYLPVVIKALPEGSFVPYGVPALTIKNTLPEFFWVTNMLETLMSNVLWMASTSATTASQFRRRFDRYAKLTGADPLFVPWQGHDFSMRGMAGIEAAALSGAGHLLSFTGTDTIPAIDLLEIYYGADSDKELIGGSVPATEHSVMSMGSFDGEFETFRRLITEVYPTGIVSIVSDTWDFWKVVTEFLPRLKDEIMARDGKVVIRPDTGDPVKIVAGDPDSDIECVRKGAIECLYDTFGGTVNAKGYKELDPHIGLIYGDGISQERQNQMLMILASKGFASTNIVLGIGSYTYQHVTRDTDGWAMKATAGATKSGGFQEIYKDPKTGDGSKKSARGYLRVGQDDEGRYYLMDRQNEHGESIGCLTPVFQDGKILRTQTLADIRKVVASHGHDNN